MQIKYFKTTNVYIDNLGQTEEDGYHFTYEPDSTEVLYTISEIIADTYFNKIKDQSEIIKAIYDFLSESDLQDELEEQYYDELKDHFEEEAFETLE